MKTKKTRKQTRAGKEAPKNVVKAAGYVYGFYTGAEGRKHQGKGDDVAIMLAGKTLDEIYTMASKHTGITQKELHEKYDKLNPGMRRMNLGNRLRGPKVEKKAGKKAV